MQVATVAFLQTMEVGNMGTRIFSWTELPVIEMKPEIKLRSLGGERLLVAKYNMDAGAFVAQHQHPHEQMICVLSGCIEFESDGSLRLLKTDDVVHIPPNVTHGGTAIEDTVTIEVFSPPRDDLMVQMDEMTEHKN